MEIDWAMIARDVVSRTDGTRDFIGVGNQFSIQDSVATVGSVVVVAKLQIAPAELGETRVINFAIRQLEEDQPFVGADYKYPIPSDLAHWGRYGNIVTFHLEMVMLPVAGEYVVELRVDGVLKADFWIRAIDETDFDDQSVRGADGFRQL